MEGIWEAQEASVETLSLSVALYLAQAGVRCSSFLSFLELNLDGVGEYCRSMRPCFFASRGVSFFCEGATLSCDIAGISLAHTPVFVFSEISLHHFEQPSQLYIAQVEATSNKDKNKSYTLIGGKNHHLFILPPFVQRQLYTSAIY